MSDGKYMRELQVAINDTINQSNDRNRLSNTPIVAISKFEMEDNDQIYFEPEHPLVLNDVNNIKEFKISNDIQGALAQAGLFISKVQQVASVYPPQMGNVGKASETATAVQNAGGNANIRSNYKSLTYEYTCLVPLYWMVIQMAWQFMHPKTAEELFDKEEISAFNPTGEYTYQPVSSAIEQESGKKTKSGFLYANHGS